VKTKQIIGISLVIVAIILIGMLIVSNRDAILKYCDTADDCATSCGGKIGRGSCYNKAFVNPHNPPDDTCCFCEDCRQCVKCECIEHKCTPVPTGDTCC